VRGQYDPLFNGGRTRDLGEEDKTNKKKKNWGPIS
jgi:hypothetical protein